VNGTTTTFTDTGLQNGREYFYFVAANNAVGGSPNSNEVSVIPAAAATVPPTPVGVFASAGNNSVALGWNASAGATSYSIFRGTAPGAEGTTAVGTSTTTSYTDSAATNGTTYFYRIRATNSAGSSALSAEVSATPSATSSGLLSQNHPATASSLENGTLTAAKAVDGNTGTRWSSAFSDPQWIQVDLGATHSISRVVLNWQAAYGKAFQLQTSLDGTKWTTIYSTTAGTGGVQDLSVAGSGRFVRMYGTQRGTGYGYSLWEFQVYGD
jgi:hypothetical protein